MKSVPVDVVFLDIQMPAEDGFDLIRKVGLGPMPITVFVTAHEHYAFKAFEVRALDYLTKPIEPDRLAKTFGRVKERLHSDKRGSTEEALRSVLVDLAPILRSSPFYAKRLFVPDGSKTVFLDVEKIEWIEAADYYVCIHSGPKEFLLRESMKDLATTLDPARFVGFIVLLLSILDTSAKFSARGEERA